MIGGKRTEEPKSIITGQKTGGEAMRDRGRETQEQRQRNQLSEEGRNTFLEIQLQPII